MIKSKLNDDNYQPIKTERPRGKTTKEEDRPLRVMLMKKKKRKIAREVFQ